VPFNDGGRPPLARLPLYPPLIEAKANLCQELRVYKDDAQRVRSKVLTGDTSSLDCFVSSIHEMLNTVVTVWNNVDERNLLSPRSRRNQPQSAMQYRQVAAQRRQPKAPSTPATMSKQHRLMLQVERFFRQSRNKLNIFNLFRLCRKDEISFDIVAETLLPKTATLLPKTATMSKQHSTLSKESFNL